jgi:hypothetical protein
MTYTGYIIIGPFFVPTEVTINTGHQPRWLQVWAEPIESYCGGSSVGISATVTDPDSFSFVAVCNCSSKVYWQYNTED